MHSVRPTVPFTRQTSGLVAGTFLLFVYLLTATPFAPLLTALLAATDRSHHVAIQESAQGLQVVLRHDCVNSTPHRHGMVARAFTVFAQRTASPDSDHVIQFGSVDTAQQAPTVDTASAAGSPPPDGCSACDSRIRPTDLPLVLAPCPRPPPAASGLLLNVRSTILVI